MLTDKTPDLLARLWESVKAILGPVLGFNAFGIIVLAVVIVSDNVIEWLFSFAQLLVQVFAESPPAAVDTPPTIQKLLLLAGLTFLSLLIGVHYEIERI